MNTKRFSRVFFIAIFFFCACLCSRAWAVPAAPIPHELAQPDGTVVRAVKWGDEHRSGWETENGYAIRHDEKTGYWKYVMPDADGRPSLLNGRAGIELPPAGLGRHIERHFKPLENQPLQKQRVDPPQHVVPPTGTGNLVVILVNFNNTSTTYTTGNFNSLLFGSSTNSMKDYYEEVSYGNFTVSPGPGGVVGWYTAANTHNYYGENIGGVSGDDRYPGTLVREAVIAADAAGFNFAPYDQDGDGYVDQVAIVHQGTGEEASSDPYDIWSHSWSLTYAYGQAYTTNDGVIVDDYVIMPEIYSSGISTMGVFAHEYGHALGLPDLYDTDGSSEGVGSWSLMASGSWCYVTTPGDRPSHMDAWSKYALGWVTPTAVSGTLTNEPIQQAATVDDVYQLRSGSPSTGGEYFLVENRQLSGFDAGLPGAGLLIWHIDESKLNNNGECYPPGSASCISTHYMVGLMQADNQWHLEIGTNRGNAGDPYPGSANNRSFTDSTVPGSKLWNTSASGVSVTAISNSGSTMTATLFYGATSTTTTSIVTTTTSIVTTTTSSVTTTTTALPVCTDDDGDGYGVGPGCDKAQDCDDTDPDVNPASDEICRDGIDNDCNAETVDDCGGICFFVKVLGPDNPRLETLRAFRDNTLAKTAFGRAIIRQYYHKADLISDMIERNPGLESAVKAVLQTVIP